MRKTKRTLRRLQSSEWDVAFVALVFIDASDSPDKAIYDTLVYVGVFCFFRFRPFYYVKLNILFLNQRCRRCLGACTQTIAATSFCCLSTLFIQTHHTCRLKCLVSIWLLRVATPLHGILSPAAIISRTCACAYDRFSVSCSLQRSNFLNKHLLGWCALFPTIDAEIAVPQQRQRRQTIFVVTKYLTLYGNHRAVVYSWRDTYDAWD